MEKGKKPGNLGSVYAVKRVGRVLLLVTVMTALAVCGIQFMRVNVNAATEAGDGTALTQENTVEDSGTSGTVSWELTSDGVLTVSGSGACDLSWQRNENIITVVIEDGITAIGEYAFQYCTNLSSVSLPDTLTSIGRNAFSYCTSLTEITFPAGLTEMGVEAFLYTGLTNVEIPEGLSSIPRSSFARCESLKSVTVPSGLTSIGDQAFASCVALEEVPLTEKLTYIGYAAFAGCDSLTSVTIPESVEILGESAFDSCDNLVEVSVPETTEIEAAVFCGCAGLADKNGFVIVNNILFDYFGESEDVTIPSEVIRISAYAFYRDKNVTAIEIPDGVTAIDFMAFYGCESLTSVKMPKNLTSISYLAFAACTSLTDIEIPDGVTYIGEYAFGSCTSLTHIEFPDGLEKIDCEAFSECTSLTEIYFAGNAPDFTSEDYDDDETNQFWNVTATAYYPAGNSTWTEDVMQDYGGDITWVSYEKEDISLEKCNVSYVNNTMDGLKVVWNKVSGATGYYIYRRNDDGTYNTTPTATVTGESATEWTDSSTLTGGKDYTYKVAAYYESSNGTITVGSSGTTKTCKYLKGGEVTALSNTSTGVKVTWAKVSGANGYYIFRKSSTDSDYTQVATVSGSSVVSWTDTDSLTSGKNYTYKVSAIFTNSKGQVTKGGAKTTKTIKYLSPGKISSITNTSSGAYIKWTKVTGATGYYVYRKASSASSYTLVKTITSVGTVTYTDTAVKEVNNVTYTYYVQPYFKSSAGVITKAGYTTKTVVRLGTPSISSLTNSSSKAMTVKWGTKSGVTGYQVQYSASSSFASGNKTLTLTGSSTSSKVVSSLTKGKTYYVRIRSYKTVNGTTYYSAWCTVKSVKISK